MLASTANSDPVPEQTYRLLARGSAARAAEPVLTHWVSVAIKVQGRNSIGSQMLRANKREFL